LQSRHPRNNIVNGLHKVTQILLVAAGCAAMLSAAGCSVRVQGKRRPLVRVEKIQGEVILTTEENTEEWKSGGTKQKNSSSLTTEELHLHTHGDVFDYRLMSYLASVGFGLNQQEFESETGDDSTTGDMKSYHLNMSFLPLKPYPFSIDTSRTEVFSPRRFQSPLRLETTSNSFFTRLRVPDWPMTFSWKNDEIEQSSDFRGNTDFFTRTSERFSYSLIHDFSKRSHLDFRSDLDELTQEGTTFARRMKTFRNSLQHDFNFGDYDQHHLNTSISHVKRTGDFKSETFNWLESLHLKHSSSFSTFYNAYITENTFDVAESRTIGGVAGFSHKLYDNFNTNFNLFASKTEFSSDAESKWHGGELEFDYYRNNPWGRLTSEYRARMTSGETTGATGTGVVTGESHTFTDPFAITLNKRNIIISTIVVTNKDQTEIYTEGVDGDYTIRQVGDQTELIIDITDADLPNITDGQEILVDYLYEVENFTEEDSLYQFFRIEQEFNNGLSIYYTRRDRETELDSSGATPLSDRVYKTDTFGASYRNDIIRLNAEHSETESTDNSSESDRLSASAFWALSPRTSLHGRISQTWVESRGERPRETSLFKAEVGLKSRLTRYLRLTGEAELRKEDASDIGRTDGSRIGAALEYNRRALSLKAGWDHYILKRRTTDTATSTFYLRLIRRF